MITLTTLPLTDAFTFSPSPPPSHDGTPPRPPTNFLQERDMPMLGAMPLAPRDEPGRGLLRCDRCTRVTMESSWAEHQQSEASPSKKVRVDENGDPNYKGLKQSVINRLEKTRQKQAKEQARLQAKEQLAERKRLKASGPIDLDRHCGVINDKNLPCSRSLTCKTHTVGAKRAVDGRTRPYDELYLDWQRVNNPNFKEPARKEPIVKSKLAAIKKKPAPARIDERSISDGELHELVHWASVSGAQARLVIDLIGTAGKTTPATECTAIWPRRSAYEGIGSLFVNALAARPPRPPLEPVSEPKKKAKPKKEKPAEINMAEAMRSIKATQAQAQQMQMQMQMQLQGGVRQGIHFNTGGGVDGAAYGGPTVGQLAYSGMG